MTAATWNRKPYPNRCPIHDPCNVPCCPKAAIVEHRNSRPMTQRSFMTFRGEFDGKGYAVQSRHAHELQMHRHCDLFDDDRRCTADRRAAELRASAARDCRDS